MRRQGIIRFVDLVALIYHEARNVRHLPDDGCLPSESYARLTSLARNKFAAWDQLREVRLAAATCDDASGVTRLFATRFGISPPELEELYRHPDWRNADIGGNAWAAISAAVIELGNAIDSEEPAVAEQLLDETMEMRHNTGVVQDKLILLERSAAEQEALE